jgi:hypothetical protein
MSKNAKAKPHFHANEDFFGNHRGEKKYYTHWRWGKVYIPVRR